MNPHYYFLLKIILFVDKLLVLANHLSYEISRLFFRSSVLVVFPLVKDAIGFHLQNLNHIIHILFFLMIKN